MVKPVVKKPTKLPVPPKQLAAAASLKRKVDPPGPSGTKKQIVKPPSNRLPAVPVASSSKRRILLTAGPSDSFHCPNCQRGFRNQSVSF